MTGLQWPPRTKSEMMAWQARKGSDAAIARALGKTDKHIGETRRKWGVPSLVRRSVAAMAKSRQWSEEEIADAFKGRRFK